MRPIAKAEGRQKGGRREAEGRHDEFMACSQPSGVLPLLHAFLPVGHFLSGGIYLLGQVFLGTMLCVVSILGHGFAMEHIRRAK